MEKVTPRCFVLMPFGDEYDKVYNCIHNAVVTSGWICSRHDREPWLGLITVGVFDKILEADLIIIDTSSSNPNVIYEMGFAHTLNKPTILLGEMTPKNKVKLPFNFSHHVALPYNLKKLSDSVKIEELGCQIAATCNNFLTKKDIGPIDNPISNAMRDHLYPYKLLKWDHEWIWGFEKTYNEEKKAKEVYGICQRLTWEQRSPLYRELIIERTRAKHRTFLIAPEIARDDDTDNKLVKNKIVEDLSHKLTTNAEDIEKYFKIILINDRADIFEFMGNGYYIYDPNKGIGRARAYTMEPMASREGDDPVDPLIEDCINNKQLCTLVNLMEKTFDIQIQNQDKVEKLKCKFEKLWNQEVEKQKKPSSWKI